MEQLSKFKGSIQYQMFPKMVDLNEGVIFRIVKVLPAIGSESEEEIVVKGDIPDWDKEDELEFHGTLEEDPKWGTFFKAVTVAKLIPESVKGKQEYLARNVAGVGPGRAVLLTDYFGNEIIHVLDTEPLRLHEVSGLGKATVDKIIASWQEEHNPLMRAVGLWLADYGYGQSWPEKFIAAFGSEVIEIVNKNPYLAVKIDGIGFLKADELAARMGWPERCTQRTEAAVEHAISGSISDGHCFMYHAALIDEIRKVASSRKGTKNESEQLPEAEAEAAVDAAVKNGELIRQEVNINKIAWVFYYLPYILKAENELAQRIGELQSVPHIAPRNIEDTLDRVGQDLSMEFNQLQRDAVIAAFQNNLSVLTGGPGTGKTSVVKMLLRAASRLGLSVDLCAPTGRAAKRMTEVTSQEAQTIHKLLEWSPEDNDFRRNHKWPLRCSLLVVDESSMLDLQLANSLMDAVPDSCSVVFVGDVDQLPSVGPGMVLRDLIGSKSVHVTRLETIFRQAEDSLIVRNAYKIRNGEMPIFPDVSKGRGVDADSYFMEVPLNSEGKADLDYVKTALPRIVERVVAKLGIDPIRDIQVLTPMRVGPAGFPEFNKVLQEALNPKGREHLIKGQKFRVGDRVMQLVNNYQPGMCISNGDIGFVEDIDEDARELLIDFYGRMVRYPYAETSHLVLAYASTIHKSQGSEYKVVILIVTTHHWNMLERNLLYTANTRAKNLIVFLASSKAIKRGVEQANVSQRNTFLVQRIRREVRSNELKLVA